MCVKIHGYDRANYIAKCILFQCVPPCRQTERKHRHYRRRSRQIPSFQPRCRHRYHHCMREEKGRCSFRRS